VEKMEKEVFEDSVVVEKKRLLDVAKMKEEICRDTWSQEKKARKEKKEIVQEATQEIALQIAKVEKLAENLSKVQRRFEKDNEKKENVDQDVEIAKAKQALIEKKIGSLKVVEASGNKEETIAQLKEMVATVQNMLNQYASENDEVNSSNMATAIKIWKEAGKAFKKAFKASTTSEAEKSLLDELEIAKKDVTAKEQRLTRATERATKTKAEQEQLQKDLENASEEKVKAENRLQDYKTALTTANTRLKEAEEKLAQASKDMIDPTRNAYRAAVDRKCEEPEVKIRQIVSHKSVAIMTAGVGLGTTAGYLITGALTGTAIGSIVPGAGTAIGATVGTIIGLAAIGISWLYTKHQGVPAIGEVLGEKSRIQATSRQESRQE
jgi:DNA repair exonuclease SbcCD ATPase subunit